MNQENAKVRGQRLFFAAARQLVMMVGTALILYGLIWVFPIGATANSQLEAPVVSSLTIVPYTGTLTDQNGNPINGSRTVRFSLWDLPAGGTMLWPTSGTPESHTLNIQDGQFHVNLGSTSGNSVPPTIGGQDLWLQIQVGNEILQPRQQLGVSLNAIEAINAQNVPDGSITQIQAPFAPKLYYQPDGGSITQVNQPIIYSGWFHGGSSGQQTLNLSSIFSQIDAVLVTKTRTSGGVDTQVTFNVTDASGLNKPTPSEIKISAYSMDGNAASWIQAYVVITGR